MIMLPGRAPLVALALAAPLTFARPALADTNATPHTHRHHHAARHRTLVASGPIHPLTAPTHPASESGSAAPVPNQSVTKPIDNSDQQTTLAPAVMQIHYPPQGDGYTDGSSAQAMDDRNAAKVTGVQLHVPLGQ